MKDQAILWFQDGVKLKTPETRWRSIDMLTQELISLSGTEGYDNLIVPPRELTRRLFNLVNFRDFSCVVDLSGFLKERIEGTFPGIKPISNFRLSRVREVSSPRLDGSGFLLSMNQDAISKLQDDADMSKPLILDDVAWSGRTILETVRLLGLNPESTTIGLLMANEGNFGKGKPGAKELLEGRGMKVARASFALTPVEDGFHLADFFNMEPLDQAFEVILAIQKAREDGMEDITKQLLRENAALLFPSAISTEEARQLESDGRLISPGGISRDSLFDINPPNWLMPSFSKRTRWRTLWENRRNIVSVLGEFRRVTQEASPSKEAEMTKQSPESSIIRGKERL